MTKQFHMYSWKLNISFANMITKFLCLTDFLKWLYLITVLLKRRRLQLDDEMDDDIMVMIGFTNSINIMVLKICRLLILYFKQQNVKCSHKLT